MFDVDVDSSAVKFQTSEIISPLNKMSSNGVMCVRSSKVFDLILQKERL